MCGSLEFYDKSYDRITTKNEVPLVGVNRIFHKVTTTDDPIIRKVFKKKKSSVIQDGHNFLFGCVLVDRLTIFTYIM